MSSEYFLDDNVIDIESYYIVNGKMFNSILDGIDYNFFLILFTMGCVCGILCSIKKPKNNYALIQNAEPVEAEVIKIV